MVKNDCSDENFNFLTEFQEEQKRLAIAKQLNVRQIAQPELIEKF